MLHLVEIVIGRMMDVSRIDVGMEFYGFGCGPEAWSFLAMV